MRRPPAGALCSIAAAELAARQMVLDGLLATKQPAAADVATAQADLRLAKSIAETQRLAGERALAEAGAAAADATDELNAKQALLLAAEKAVANASTATSARRAALSSATRARDLASRRAGVQVPADEVVFVASSPVRVSESLVGLGDPATGGVAKVTDAVVHIEGALAVNDANLVKATMRVKVEEPDLGIATEGIVTSVAAAPGTNGVDGFHVFVEIAVVAPPANLVGASVRLTIPVRSSGGPVLAVPLSALSLAPDGSSRVQRDKGEGATEFVTVEAGLSAEGYVAVTAGDASLKVGDRVVAGLAQNG